VHEALRGGDLEDGDVALRDLKRGNCGAFALKSRQALGRDY
jgi:hypothetical protein